MNVVRLRTSACVLVLSAAATLASAQTLQPFQQEALDKILATVEPEIRPMMRAQLAPTLAILNEAQVSMMLEGLAAQAEDTAPAEEVVEDTPASPEDLAYNRAQYEPMMRKAWDAGKAFDDFVEAELAEQCPPDDGRFAVFGSAWRYEVYPLAPTWPTVSRDVDVEVEVVGGSYAPQDGRYDFDFSEVRLTFDAAAVERAVAEACKEYVAIGEAFLAEAGADAQGDEVPPNGMRIEQSANAKVGTVRERLEALLSAQAPGGNYALLTALMNGRRVR
jgi:hypothetical protein